MYKRESNVSGRSWGGPRSYAGLRSLFWVSLDLNISNYLLNHYSAT